jgi:hypothetical protein
MSPIEIFMDKILHAEKPKPNKYLWLCTVVDEETNMCNSLQAYLRSGRLGELSAFVEETVNGKYLELCDRLDNFEEALARKIQAFNSLLKSTKKELLQHL